MDKPRILFFSTLFTPFIEEDYRILSKHFPVRKLIAKNVEALLRIPFEVLRSDISLAWFGSVYSGWMVFCAKLLGKKSIVVVAGVDASKDTEINYGIWLSPWKSVLVRYAFRNADKLLPVDPFLEKEAKRLAEYNGENITTIAFGFDASEWTPGNSRSEMILCVAACHDEDRMKKKGVEKLIAAARSLPDIPFRLIGIHPTLMEKVKKISPPNLEIISYVPRAQLLPYYQSAKVYCQPSFTEGLPNTLCEAMLCGCIPVGTIAGGIPTAIGDSGFLVPYRDQDALVHALKAALTSPASAGTKASQRILTEFTIERREQALLKVIADLAK